jgi:hypothetical protein
VKGRKLLQNESDRRRKVGTERKRSVLATGFLMTLRGSNHPGEALLYFPLRMLSEAGWPRQVQYYGIWLWWCRKTRKVNAVSTWERSTRDTFPSRHPACPVLLHLYHLTTIFVSPPRQFDHSQTPTALSTAVQQLPFCFPFFCISSSLPQVLTLFTGIADALFAAPSAQFSTFPIQVPYPILI